MPSSLPSTSAVTPTALLPSPAGCPALSPAARRIPQEWIDQVNEATRQDPYTNSHRTIEETGEGLHAAFLARRRRAAEYAKLMGDPDFLA